MSQRKRLVTREREKETGSLANFLLSLFLSILFFCAIFAKKKRGGGEGSKGQTEFDEAFASPPLSEKKAFLLFLFFFFFVFFVP